MKNLTIPVLIAVMMSAAVTSCTSSGAEKGKQTLLDSSRKQ